MKKILYLFTAGILCLTAAGKVNAQELADFQPGGLLFAVPRLSPNDVARMNYTGGTQFGTARSTAMSGAFTSLGADLSSMHINPAGLGMYQSSEFGFTPLQTFSKVTNRNVEYNDSNNKGRFSVANVGAALNLYQGGGNLTSFTFGFGYNRIADFNYNNTFELGYSDRGNSINDIFAFQIYGISDSEIDSERIWWSDRDYDKWGAVLARRSRLLHPDGNGGYLPGALGEGTKVWQQATVKSRGSIGEYNISGGFNFQNNLYFGFSIGIQDIYLKQTIYYDELYDDNSANNPATAMFHDLHSKYTGSGVNFKVGMIYRPVEALRIGLTVHTPTFATVNSYYWASVEGEYPQDPKDPYKYKESLEDKYEYNYSTPTRLMGGISYTFGTMGVLSLDYERTWYNSMRYRTDDRSKRDFNYSSKNEFKGTNTIRVGGELRPFDGDISLRAGLTYTDSMSDIPSTSIYNSPIPKQSLGASAGIGFRIGRASYLDITYAFNQTKYSDYRLYQSPDEWSHLADHYVASGTLSQKINRHSVLASLGFRF